MTILVEILRLVLGWARRESRAWLAWASDNPGEARLQLLAFAHIAEHRHRVLASRRWAFRKRRRLVRLLSAAIELRQFAREVQRTGQCPPTPEDT